MEDRSGRLFYDSFMGEDGLEKAGDYDWISCLFCRTYSFMRYSCFRSIVV